MENNSGKLDKLMKLSIIVGVLIVALSIAYYLVIFLPKKESEKFKLQKYNLDKLEIEKTFNKASLEKCLSDAEKEYMRYAEINGNKKDDGTVWAQNDVWDRAEKNRKETKDECFTKYQNN